MTALPRATDIAGEILRAHIGLRLEPSLRGRLTRAIHDAAAHAGQSPDTYVSSIRDDPQTLQGLCDRITVQESGFFRHPKQFEVLVRHILPTLETPVRIWSAACGNGQEAYSLAMTLIESGVTGTVMATDVSSAAGERTKRGTYSEREIAGLTDARRTAHCAHDGKNWSMKPALRDLLDVGIRNLIDPLPTDVASYQVVFCRNVLIYFTPYHATSFLDRLAGELPHGAFLFLGGAESMLHISERFQARRIGDAFVYQVRHNERDTRPRSKGATRAATASSTARPARRVPARSSARRVDIDTVVASTIPATPDALAQLGNDAHGKGDHAAAVKAFRQWAYVAPNDPRAHFHLALALEASGDRAAASRAYAITRAVLRRGDAEESIDAFGGYRLDNVLRLLDDKETSQ